MNYTIPDYYKEFTCTADCCEDTCCAGWQIAIDAKSLKKYKNEKGPYRRKLRKSIHWMRSIFKQSADLRCAFLNNDNLCDMYQHLGSNYLCKTCRLYPRHIEEFEDVREITLSLSCPEVAKIVLNKSTPVTFYSTEQDGIEEYEDFDPLLYSLLVDAREVMIKLIQNRALPIDIRTKLIFGISHDMQIRINSQNLFSCYDVLDKYQTDSALQYVRNDTKLQSVDYAYHRVKRAFFVLEQMEPLRSDWISVLKETRDQLYVQKTSESWEKISNAFLLWLKSCDFSLEIIKEQLLVYFISTYFCGAVYDGQVLAKTNIALTSVLLIEELLKSVWLRNECSLDMTDIVEIVYRYSREIEHSDQNLERLASSKIFV